METTRLSSKGQVVLPLSVRRNRKWEPGTQLTVEETKDGVLLRAAKPFPPTTVDELIGILDSRKYTGKPKTVEQMDASIANEVRRNVVLAVDTNVLVRFLARDDADQTARADNLFRGNQIWISKTVLLETEWVLRDTYSFDRDRITADFRSLLGIRTAHAEDEGAVADALDWFAAGMDFADALHLASSERASQFATFDRKFATRAAKLPGVKVLLLR